MPVAFKITWAVSLLFKCKEADRTAPKQHSLRRIHLLKVINVWALMQVKAVVNQGQQANCRNLA